MEQDLAPCDMIRKEGLGEEYFLKHRQSHKWYWMSKQTSAEPILFTTWKSHRLDNEIIGNHQTFECIASTYRRSWPTPCFFSEYDC
jgi:hypothetical protein